MAVDNWLIFIGWRLVQKFPAFHQGKIITEFSLQAVFIIPDNGKVAALCWSFAGKGGDDDISTICDGSLDLIDVGGPVVLFCQEVECRPIPPQTICVRWQTNIKYISDHPLYFGTPFSQPGLRYFQGGLGYIEHRNIRLTAKKQIVHKGRSSATNIDHGVPCL